MSASKPTHIFKHGIMRFDWEPEKIQIEIDHLHVERGGEIKGRVLVSTTAPARPVLLHRSVLNLDSTRARADIVKVCAERAEDVDWKDIFEQVCFLTSDAFTEGAPAIVLDDAVRPANAGWVLPPMLLAGQPTILFGDGSSAKSYLALAAAISIQTGWELLHIKPTTRLNVMYLDWESDDWSHQDRMRRLVGDDRVGIIYRPCVGPLVNQTEAISREIVKYDIGFLVLDSVGLACAGDPNESQAALGFFAALRSLEVGGSCLIAHNTKVADAEKPFGSVYWHNSARSTWFAKKHQETGSKTFQVGLINKKPPENASLATPLGFTFAFDDATHSTTIELTDVRDMSTGIAGQVALWRRVAHDLKTGTKSITVLADALDADPDALRRVFQRDAGKLFVRIPGIDGIPVYGLKQGG